MSKWGNEELCAQVSMGVPCRSVLYLSSVNTFLGPGGRAQCWSVICNAVRPDREVSFLTSQKWRAAGKAECSYEPLNCCRWWEEICRFFCFTAARCSYRNCGAFLINAVLRSRLCTEYFKCLWGETHDLSFFFSFLIVGILFQEIRLFFVSVWLS